jgi:hypothetical protein
VNKLVDHTINKNFNKDGFAVFNQSYFVNNFENGGFGHFKIFHPSVILVFCEQKPLKTTLCFVVSPNALIPEKNFNKKL